MSDKSLEEKKLHAELEAKYGMASATALLIYAGLLQVCGVRNIKVFKLHGVL